ncbi:MAG: hypothetical protein IMZ40_01035 [Bacilli bacterium]|nr:hypothetical protein [Bacilli bacterium]
MLTIFDKYQSIIISVILVFYVINAMYIGSSELSIILFFFVIVMQLVRMRKKIQQLSFIQLIAIFAIMIASIVALLFIFSGFNYLINAGILTFPDWMVIIIQIALILVFLLSVTSIIKNLFQRFTRPKE